MSSFTIDKKEYVKAAGFIAGIAKGVSYGCHEFWLYDHKAHKNTDKDLFYKRFVQCYEMNAESVKKQYRGQEVGAPANDQNTYKEEFEQYFRKGQSITTLSREKQIQAVKDIQMFLQSSLYQTEDEKYNFMMTHWYNLIINELTSMVLLSGYDSENWGSFNTEISTEVHRIA